MSHFLMASPAQAERRPVYAHPTDSQNPERMKYARDYGHECRGGTSTHRLPRSCVPPLQGGTDVLLHLSQGGVSRCPGLSPSAPLGKRVSEEMWVIRTSTAAGTVRLKTQPQFGPCPPCPAIFFFASLFLCVRHGFARRFCHKSI